LTRPKTYIRSKVGAATAQGVKTQLR